MSTSHASVAIPSPAKYMARLCNHFAHRVPVQREASRARIEFPNAPCSLVATESHLEMQLETQNAQDRDRLQEVITRHLKQVASAESFEVSWQVSAAGEAAAHPGPR